MDRHSAYPHYTGKSALAKRAYREFKSVLAKRAYKRGARFVTAPTGNLP